MTPEQQATREFEAWYIALPIYPASGGPARGTITAALVVLERLQKNYDLSLDSHRAPGKSQIKGTGSTAVSRILSDFGENRPFLKEGGRTNRGVPRDISTMLLALQSAHLENLAAHERTRILEKLQAFLVDKVRDFHNRQRLKLTYDPRKSTWYSINDLLNLAREVGKEGPVAQYLVGAKLQLRFPNMEISNESFSTADDQLGRYGDFHINDTVFHVTVSPMTGVYEKCKQNLANGLRVFLLVPEKVRQAAKQNAEAVAPEKITVEAIESFVAQNIDELSGFSHKQLIDGFRRLLETYNARVDRAENDKSFLVEIPRNLR